LERVCGVTAGKLVPRTRVIDMRGNRPRFVQILRRTFTRLVPFEPLSFLGDTGEGWHDRWSGTRVVRLPRRLSGYAGGVPAAPLGRPPLLDQGGQVGHHHVGAAPAELVAATEP